jgi:hypothetical protein
MREGWMSHESVGSANSTVWTHTNPMRAAPLALGTASPLDLQRMSPRGESQLMKSYHAMSGGGLESLVLREEETRPPGPREALMRVRANSLNFREVSVLRGTYPLPVRPDVVMGADGAGEIVEIGPGTTRVKVGDRVAVAMFPRWIDGTFAWELAPQVGG